MLLLAVDTFTGHYGRPGAVKQGQTHTTLPFPPPSTIRGFLESLGGMNRGELKGEFAYAVKSAPWGAGTILRRDHVWTSGMPNDPWSKNRKGENYRVTGVRMHFLPSYYVAYKGSQEDVLRSAVAGKVKRSGVLSLGTGDNAVTALSEVSFPTSREALWIVRGDEFRLTVHTTETAHRMEGRWASFALCPSTTLPSAGWRTA